MEKDGIFYQSGWAADAARGPVGILLFRRGHAGTFSVDSAVGDVQDDTVSCLDGDGFGGGFTPVLEAKEQVALVHSVVMKLDLHVEASVDSLHQQVFSRLVGLQLNPVQGFAGIIVHHHLYIGQGALLQTLTAPDQNPG